MNLNTLLSSTGASVIIYIAIVLLFIAGLIVCAFPVMETRRRLRAGIRSIRSKSKKHAWQDEHFLGKGSLSVQWSAYLKNLHFSDGGYNVATNVEDFINEETVIYGPGRTSFGDAVPGLLTSLGFLGTLIGLSAGLSGFDMTNSLTAQQSIVVLIPAMKYAFMTSIFGVIASVLFTMLTRMVNGSAEKTLREFYVVLNNYTGVHSVDPLTQMATYQQELNDLMRVVVQDINGRFTDRLSEILVDSMRPLQKTMQDYVDVSSKEQMRFLDNIVTRFVERMEAALSGKLGSLTLAIEDSIQAQKDAQGALREDLTQTAALLDQMRETRELSDALLDEMRQYMEFVNASQERVNENYDRVASTVEKMDVIARQQNAYLKTISQLNTDTTRTMDTLVGSVNELCERLTVENEAIQANTEHSITELGKMSASLEKMQKTSLRVVESELKAMLHDYKEYANLLSGSVQKLSAAVEHDLSTLPSTIKQSCNLITREVDRMGATLVDANRALDDAVDKLYTRK